MVHLRRTSDEKRPGRGRQRINPREFATTGPRTPETAANHLLHRGLRQDGSGDQRGVSKLSLEYPDVDIRWFDKSKKIKSREIFLFPVEPTSSGFSCRSDAGPHVTTRREAFYGAHIKRRGRQGSVSVEQAQVGEGEVLHTAGRCCTRTDEQSGLSVDSLSGSQLELRNRAS